MPILSPDEAYYLIQNRYDENKIKTFLKVFLPIASSSLYRNYKTIEIYNHFVSFIRKNHEIISDVLKIYINISQISNYENYYMYFLDKIGVLNNENEDIKLIQNDIDMFHVFISNDTYTLLTSVISYAIVSIYSPLQRSDIILLQFAGMILAASGHILVLCSNNDFVLKDDYDLLYYNEYHIFIKYDYYYLNKKFCERINSINDAYYYIYVSVTNRQMNSEITENPYVQIFNIAQSFDNVFDFKEDKDEKDKNVPFQIIKKQYPIENKFDINRIVVALNNCQIFDKNDVKNNWIPNKIEFKKVFIYASDFMNWYGGRIQSFSKLDITECNEYIDFNEMHYLKIDHYIQNPLYLSDIDKQTIDSIDEIILKLEDSTTMINRIKTKNQSVDKSINEKMLYAFHKVFKHCTSDNDPIKAHSNQIYAVNHSINYLTNNNNKSKGCIYEVHTGEGKSTIIRALAEILARSKKTVHIVTSNIVLACRDYEKSYEYFTECDLKSAILLHKNEFDDIKCQDKQLFYPSSEKNDFYEESWFDNPSEMNIKICKKSKMGKKCDIIFSTFFNFEGWYLREIEKHPMRMEDYFKDTYLLIDEADTILIDELTNGTIISREMKSAGIDILKRVFDLYLTSEEKRSLEKNHSNETNKKSEEQNNSQEQKKTPEQILEIIQNEFSNCSHLNKEDIESMLVDIDSALSFKEGVKYIIQYKYKWVKHIFPFDGENKGIVERDKEFSGFIHQFIGIKENLIDPTRKIEIRPFSINYSFISHPIYINLYQGVLGFTGTIGSNKDKEILKKYYKLDTVKIPDFGPNYRKDLPHVLCSNEDEKNKKILEEIEFYHRKKIPVLAIFDSISQIEQFQKYILKKFYSSQIKVFDGASFDKTKMENESGKEGSITLGTNFCGRGTDIKYDDDKPLHVIITFGPKNVRAMNQACGRTGRNGKHGTTRIICIEEQFYKSLKIINNEIVNKILSEYDLKMKHQSIFIKSFREKYPWIFNHKKADIISRFSNDDKANLRDIEINVNRSTAINYQFPICMSVDTFINIQLQKIFSLRNCPECKYTRYLFIRYMRELLLESWSLFINKITKNYEIEKQKNRFIDFKYFIEKQVLNLIEKLDFFPEENYVSLNKTYMLIHQKVAKDWTEIITDPLKGIFDFRKTNDSKAFLFFKTGIYPFEIKDEDGSRLFLTDGKDSYKSINFIKDPELLYLKKDKPFSITYIIDDIFERICRAIDQSLVGFFGFHLFMRRTLAGVEFGICVDPFLIEIETKEEHCLFDRSPIFLLTIGCKSAKPFIAAILIMVLVFVTIVSVKIASFFTVPGMPIVESFKSLGDCFLKLAKAKFKEMIIEKIAQLNPIQEILTKVIDWLMKQIKKQSLDSNDPILIVMNFIMTVLDGKFAKNISQKISDKIFDFIKINPDAKMLFSKVTPILQMIKIGVLIVLLIAMFIKNYQAKHALKHASSYQNDFLSHEKIFSDYQSYKDIDSNVKEKAAFLNDDI